VEVTTIKERLLQLGYTATENDDAAIDFAIRKVAEHIYNQCAITAIPEGLEPFAIDAVCGEFLGVLRNIGKLDETYNIEQGMSSIKVGDTSVNLDGKSRDELIDYLVSSLTNGLEGEMLCFRRIRW
jgi:hypothetical protein